MIKTFNKKAFSIFIAWLIVLSVALTPVAAAYAADDDNSPKNEEELQAGESAEDEGTEGKSGDGQHENEGGEENNTDDENGGSLNSPDDDEGKNQDENGDKTQNEDGEPNTENNEEKLPDAGDNNNLNEDENKPEKETKENEFYVENTEELKAAFDKINNLGTGEFTVALDADLDSVGRISLCKPVKVSLLGGGHKISFTCGDGNNNGGICLSGGAVLELGAADGTDSLVLTGSVNNGDGGLIYIFGASDEIREDDGGTLNMYKGAVLSEITAKCGFGGAVTLCGKNTAFNMYGGTIESAAVIAEERNAFGGGVGVDKGTFNFIGGEIKSCTALSQGVNDEAGYGGGVAVISGSMHCTPEEYEYASITGCSADFGGGVYIAPSCEAVSISSCIIQGNRAEYIGGGLFNAGTDLTLNTVSAEGNSAGIAGGGICLFETNGAEIMNSSVIHNYTQNGYGGGLAIENCGFVSADASNRIYSNTAGLCAADVYIKNSSVTLSAAPEVAYESALSPLSEGNNNTAWFDDGEAARYEHQKMSERKTISAFNASGEEHLSLLAANVTGYCTVSFEMNGVGEAVADVEVPENTALTPPSVGAVEGYSFAGWFTDAEFTAEYDFSLPVSADMTLYAKWTAAELTVSFEMNGIGTAPEAKKLSYGEKLTMPEEPTDTVCSFGGWYIDAKLNNAFDANTEIKADTVLYAKWVMNYTVEHYKQKQGTDGKDIEFDKADTEEKSAAVGTTVNASTKAYPGYKADASVPDTVSSGIIKRDAPLVLKLYYRINSLTVSYELGGGTGDTGSDYSAKNVSYGSQIRLPSLPRKTGYKFMGWQVGDEVYQPGDTVPISSDTKFAAIWEQADTIPVISPTPRPIPTVVPTARPVYTRPGYQGGYGIKTGDTSNIGVWAALLGVSLLGIGGAAFMMFKKKKK